MRAAHCASSHVRGLIIRIAACRVPLTAGRTKGIISGQLCGRKPMNIQQTSKKPQVAIMNAVHDLPVLVARVTPGSSCTGVRQIC